MGFWKIRVIAEGQIEELPIKVEKHYLPAFEVVALMRQFTLDTDELIEASIEGAFITERIAQGNVSVTWYAKKIDYQTPMFNDSVVYRQKYNYRQKVSNFYHSALYYGGQEDVGDSNQGSSWRFSPFDDRYANKTFGPNEPLQNEWTLIRQDVQIFSRINPVEPFTLFLEEVEAVMGQKTGIQVGLISSFMS